jgi:Transcriptional Coactivator p15 (PC4)
MAKRDENTEYQTYDEPEGEVIIDLGDNKKVTAEFSTFDGQRYWSLRTWVKKRDGSWIRTKNGLTLTPDRVRELHRNLGDYIQERAKKKARR